jgi:hypothetical protein
MKALLNELYGEPETVTGQAPAVVDINELADIQDVVIDRSLPRAERIKSYIRQIKNPLLYRCDDAIIRVSFADTDVSLEDALKHYLLSRQGFTFILQNRD